MKSPRNFLSVCATLLLSGLSALPMRADTVDLYKADGWEFPKTSEIEARIKNAQKPVLLLFCWTQPGTPGNRITLTYRPVMRDLAEYYGPSFEFIAVDTSVKNDDDMVKLSNQYKASSIPTLILFQKGTESGRLVGIKSPAIVCALLNSKLTDPAVHDTLAKAALDRAQKASDAAAKAAQGGDTLGAGRLYLDAAKVLVDITQKSPQTALATDLLQNKALVAGMTPDKLLKETLLPLEISALSENLFLLNNFLAVKTKEVSRDYTTQKKTVIALASDGKWDKAAALAQALPLSEQADVAATIAAKLPDARTKPWGSAATAVDWAISLAGSPEASQEAREALAISLLNAGLGEKARSLSLPEDRLAAAAASLAGTLVNNDDPSGSAAKIESLKLPLTPADNVSLHLELANAYASAKQPDKAATEYQLVADLVSKNPKPFPFLYNNLSYFHGALAPVTITNAFKIASSEPDGLTRTKALIEIIDYHIGHNNTAVAAEVAAFIKSHPPESLNDFSSEARYSVVRNLLAYDQYAAADAVMRAHLAKEPLKSLLIKPSADPDLNNNVDALVLISNLSMEMQAIYALQKAASKQGDTTGIKFYTDAFGSYETFMNGLTASQPNAASIVWEVKAPSLNSTELELNRAKMSDFVFDLFYNSALESEMQATLEKSGMDTAFKQIPPGIGLVKSLQLRERIIATTLKKNDPNAYAAALAWIKEAEDSYEKLTDKDESKDVEDIERSMLSALVSAGKAVDYAQKDALSYWLKSELVQAAWSMSFWSDVPKTLAPQLYAICFTAPKPDDPEKTVKNFHACQASILRKMAEGGEKELAPKGLATALAKSGDKPAWQTAVLGNAAKSNLKNNPDIARSYAVAALAVIEQNGIGEEDSYKDLQSVIIDAPYLDLAYRLAAKMEKTEDKVFLLRVTNNTLIGKNRWKESQEVLDRIDLIGSSSTDIHKDEVLAQKAQTFMALNRPADALTAALSISDNFSQYYALDQLAAYAALHDVAWPPEAREKLAALAKKALGEPDLKTPASIANPF